VRWLTEGERRQLADELELTSLPNNLDERAVEGQMIGRDKCRDGTRCRDKQQAAERHGLRVALDSETTEQPLDQRLGGGQAEHEEPINELDVNIGPQGEERREEPQAAGIS